jgi:ABC-type amino acid transport substrate-binding protein
MMSARAGTIRGAARRSRCLRPAAGRRAVAGALLAGLAALVLSAVPGPGGAARAEELLRVITSGGYAPFEYYAPDGALAGFDIDVANALCGVLAVRCAFTDVPFEQAIPALVARRGDIIVASMTITEDRKRLVAFTNRYYRTPMQLIAPKGFGRPMTRDGLKGLKIGVEPQAFSERYARQAFGGAAEIVRVAGTPEDLHQALIDGKVDLILADTLANWQFINSPEGRRFTFVGEPIYGNEDIGIAVRKDDDALRRRLNAALARIRLDGTYQKINAKYFPFDIY